MKDRNTAVASDALHLAKLAREMEPDALAAAALLSAAALASVPRRGDRRAVASVVSDLLAPGLAEFGLVLTPNPDVATHAIIVDDRDLSERMTQIVRAMLSLSRFVTPDTTEQAAGLVTAATVLIERQVGPVMAGNALGALLEPTLATWAMTGATETRQ